MGKWRAGSGSGTETHVFVSIFGSDCLPSKLSGAQASSVFADIPDEFLTDVELGKFSDGDIRVCNIIN